MWDEFCWIMCIAPQKPTASQLLVDCQLTASFGVLKYTKSIHQAIHLLPSRPHNRSMYLFWHFNMHNDTHIHMSSIFSYTAFSKRFWRVGYLLGGVGWVTPGCRKVLWGPLRGDGQTFQGDGSVSLQLPGFWKALWKPHSVQQEWKMENDMFDL